MQNSKKFKTYCLIICFLFIFMGVISLFYGQAKIPFSSFFERGSKYYSIVFEIRLPRFLLASSVGILLSLSGLIVQTIFRNPLVDPYFLGISSAAQLGVSVAIIMGASKTLLGISLASFLAFIFSLLLTFILVRISTAVSSEYSQAAIVLIGIAISYVLSAFNNFLSIFKQNVFLESTFWTLRGFNNADINQFVFTIPFLVAGIIYLLLNSKRMNIYLSGNITAHSLGINLKFFTGSMLAVSALLTSVSVIVSGTIIFVGLFVPHIARMLVGDERKRLVIITCLLGSLIMSLFDFIARSVLPSQEVPINIIASLIGAPFFIYLFFRVRKNALHRD
jgi:iron complex transport system permease protein